MSSVPSFLELTLLSLAAYRVWFFFAHDTIIDRPRNWLEKKIPWSADLLECPYCSGTYIALGWWAAWRLWPETTLDVASAFAVMAVLAIIHVVLSDD